MRNTDNLIEVDFEPSRVSYLLDLYRINQDDLFSRVYGERKEKALTEFKNSTQNKKIKIGMLKKIDLAFGKGLNWYISSRPLKENKSASIFFRKDKFNTELNFEAKKITSKFEEKKFQLQALCDAINYEPKKKLKTYKIEESPEEIARDMRKTFDIIERKLIESKKIKRPADDFTNLKNFIQILGELDIVVFEFIEQWKKKEKANFSGCFMTPNIIVLQRQQKYYRREIFTLIHEFAHYLIDIEEIDNMLNEDYLTNLQSKIEQWCNDFAYYFLVKDYDQRLNEADKATKENEFLKDLVNDLYKKTLLSNSALYTRLLIKNKISRPDYDNKIHEIADAITKEREEKKTRMREEREFLKQQGIKPHGFASKPIQSNLYKEIVKINFFEGHIDETRLCNYLQIKPERISKELY